MLTPFLRLLAVAGIFMTTAVSGTEFRGRLDPEVQRGTRVVTAVEPAAPELVSTLPVPPAPGDKVWAPRRGIEIKGRRLPVALVAAAKGGKVLWVDRDGDGRFGADESFPLPAPGTDVSLSFSWNNGIYRDFPIAFQYSDKPFGRAANAAEAPVTEPDATRVTSIVYNFNVVFSGSVEVDGKSLRLMFSPKPADTRIDPPNQRVSVDADFNGRFEPEKGEAVNGSGRNPVFRVGSRHLAVRTADVLTGDLVLEERPAAEFTRFDALPGQLMPDFSFVDFDGRERRLADFRGKVVLLDFWGTWCGPCIEEMKHLDPLYAKYAPRGFEVIGMNMERTSGRLSDEEYAEVNRKASAFVGRAGHRWLQATQKSIERFAQDVIQVNLYPTCILIGPDGRVISREARGAALAALLERHLPTRE